MDWLQTAAFFYVTFTYLIPGALFIVVALLIAAAWRR